MHSSLQIRSAICPDCVAGCWQLGRYLAFDQSSGVLLSFFTDGGPGILLAAWALVYRALALRSARRLIIADRARYDVAWEAAAEGLDGQHALLELRDAARAAATARIPCRNFNYPLARIVSDGGGGGGVIGGVQQLRQLVMKPVTTSYTGGGADTSLQTPSQSLLLRIRRMESWSDRSTSLQPVPLTNLDVLYVQAVLMHPILAHKALDWAIASRGWFQRVPEGQPGDGLDPLVCPAEEPRGKIQWALVKKVTRAYEKMQRSYHSVCPTTRTLMHPGTLTASVLLFVSRRLSY
jgi:hypothetical protein